ncbi:fatty acid desaturase-domain-containing protein [Phellopilus nigrolimitatus]|nr:fatty acid desaturase-domain-containing protein [Phellopilus nigrolimitatus]
MAFTPEKFAPLTWSMSEIRGAIPAHLFKRDTFRATTYLLRDITLTGILWWAATWIDPFFIQLSVSNRILEGVSAFGRIVCWMTYWWFQGLVFTGIWTIGHECGHGAFSPSSKVCDGLGYVLHTLLWTPYFSWKIVHHRHHANHASMEKDEVYIPKTRSDLGIPTVDDKGAIDYDDYFGDTPIWTLLMLLRQQFLAFPAYLFLNVSGQKHYPKWTNHFNPNAILFNASQRNAVIASDIGMLAMVALTAKASNVFGFWSVAKYYGIPWLCVTHWFIMITYLHHTSANLPHYREGKWNFQRGAAATVDRDFLGWQGRFLLHDVAHFHVVHHFFPQMPFYHGEEATGYLRRFIGEHYHQSDEPVFNALWRTYNECQFVEDEGDVLFYKNKKGQYAAQQ